MTFISKLFKNPQPTQPEQNPFDMPEQEQPKPVGKLDLRFLQVIREAEQASREKIQQMESLEIGRLLLNSERSRYLITRNEHAEREPSDTLDPFNEQKNRFLADFEHTQLVKRIYGQTKPDKTKPSNPTAIRHSVDPFNATSKATTRPTPPPAASAGPTTALQEKKSPSSPCIPPVQQQPKHEEETQNPFDIDDNPPPTQIRGNPGRPPATTTGPDKQGDIEFADDDEKKPAPQPLPPFAPAATAKPDKQVDIEFDDDDEKKPVPQPLPAFAPAPTAKPDKQVEIVSDDDDEKKPVPQPLPAFASETSAESDEQVEIVSDDDDEKKPVPDFEPVTEADNNPASVENLPNSEQADSLKREENQERDNLEALQGYSRALFENIERRERAEVVQIAPQTPGAVRTLINQVSTVASVLFHLSFSGYRGNQFL